MAASDISLASAASPLILTPAPASNINKSLTPSHNAYQTPSISTNKEWVVPPRPKPGRKPAADTPPTKRKAQNREAQRAFRERRAAKVGELEDQMKRIQEQDQKDLVELKSRVEQLEGDVVRYHNLLASWELKYEEKELAWRRERQLRQNAEVEIEYLRRGAAVGTDPVPLPPRRAHQNGVSESVALQDGGSGDMDDMSCGRCRNDTRCQCIEEAFEMSGIVAENSYNPNRKRPHSPPNGEDLRRARRTNTQSDDDPTEIDFTAQFSNQRHPNPTSTLPASSPIPAIAAQDRCGFCEDGTPCICEALDPHKSKHCSTDIEEVNYNVIPNPPITNGNTRASCTNNPGTCAQCRSNPTSTLFCKSLAATRSAASSMPGLVTGSQNTGRAPSNYPAATSAGPTLTCADAFTTLSRHPAFPEATDELGTWVSQLSAVPASVNTEGRTAFEIEVASVMGVLKTFDRRFGDTRNSSNAI